MDGITHSTEGKWTVTTTTTEDPDRLDDDLEKTTTSRYEDADNATSAVTEWPGDNAGEDVETDDEAADSPRQNRPSRRRLPPKPTAAIAAAIMIAALSALVGWLGVQLQHAQQASRQQAEYLQAARQGAVNLTTIDWQHVDDDVKRIVDSATGTFYEDFSKRVAPFIDVVKHVQSKTTGTVTMAGIESVSGDKAQVLVAVTVETTNSGAPQSTSKAWRMRIDVQKVGNDVKLANVEFVP